LGIGTEIPAIHPVLTEPDVWRPPEEEDGTKPEEPVLPVVAAGLGLIVLQTESAVSMEQMEEMEQPVAVRGREEQERDREFRLKTIGQELLLHIAREVEEVADKAVPELKVQQIPVMAAAVADVMRWGCMADRELCLFATPIHKNLNKKKEKDNPFLFLLTKIKYP
jgi:hypothetical protein